MTTSLLPHNSTVFERALEAVTGPALLVQAPLREIWNPLLCPVHLLPWLAHAFSVDDWSSDWPEVTKRATIAQAVAVHKTKGTVGAVKGALAAAGYPDAKIIEQYGANFYDGSSAHNGAIDHAPQDHWAEYRVRLSAPITVEQAAQVRKILKTVAPVRSHLKALDFTEAFNIYNARISHDGQFTHGVA
jgi:phage tail P2-like protein